MFRLFDLTVYANINNACVIKLKEGIKLSIQK